MLYPVTEDCHNNIVPLLNAKEILKILQRDLNILFIWTNKFHPDTRADAVSSSALRMLTSL